MKSRPHWEYKSTTHRVTDVGYLNKEGHAGWELVYVSHGHTADWLIWKRKVKAKE